MAALTLAQLPGTDVLEALFERAPGDDVAAFRATCLKQLKELSFEDRLIKLVSRTADVLRIYQHNNATAAAGNRVDRGRLKNAEARREAWEHALKLPDVWPAYKNDRKKILDRGLSDAATDAEKQEHAKEDANLARYALAFIPRSWKPRTMLICQHNYFVADTATTGKFAPSNERNENVGYAASVLEHVAQDMMDADDYM